MQDHRHSSSGQGHATGPAAGSLPGGTEEGEDADIPWGFSFDANLAGDAAVDTLPSLGGMMSFEGFDDFLASVHNAADPSAMASLFASPREHGLPGSARSNGTAAEAERAEATAAQQPAGQAHAAAGLGQQGAQAAVGGGQPGVGRHATAAAAGSVSEQLSVSERSSAPVPFVASGCVTASLLAQ